MPDVIKPSIECWLFAESVELDALVLLLQAEAKEAHPAFWQPITGGIEPGETPEQACLRETREETSLVLGTGRIQQLDRGIDVLINAELTVRKTLFVDVADSRKVRLSDEHIGWQWVPFRDANRLLYWPSNQETYTAVNQFLQG